MRRLLAIAMALCLIPLGTTTALGASTLVDCRKGADLQAAIDGATPGDTLRLKGTCRGNFIIRGKDLTLKGSPRATLDAGGRNAALRVNHDGVSWHNLGGTVTLRGLTITGSGGDAYWADGVHAWSAEVILRDCTVKGNKGSGLGGDVVTFRLRASTVRDNAKSGVGSYGDGMKVHLDDSKIKRNGRHGVEAIGLYMKRSTIAKNGGNGVSASVQGRVDAQDSRILNNSGRGIRSRGMELVRVTVSRNRGGGVSGGWYDGPWVTIDQSTIRNNRVSRDGGGLYCRGGCIVTDSRIVGNTATGNGGGADLDPVLPDGSATLTVSDSVVANNRAGGSGGASTTARPWTWSSTARCCAITAPTTARAAEGEVRLGSSEARSARGGPFLVCRAMQGLRSPRGVRPGPLPGPRPAKRCRNWCHGSGLHLLATYQPVDYRPVRSR